MPTEILLPKLGNTMTSAIVVNTLVQPNQHVKKHQPLFEIETDKALMQIESPQPGYVKHILVQTNQTVPVGALMMLLGEKDEDIPHQLAQSLKTDQKQQSNITAKPIDIPPQTALTKEDLRTDQHQPKNVKLGDTVALTNFQKIVGQRMLLSKKTIPCFYLTAKADLTDLANLREEINKNQNPPISFNDFVIKAMSMALEKYPLLTGRLENDCIHMPKKINIAQAVAVNDDVVAPVIHDTAAKNLRQIARCTQILVQKAKNNTLKLTELEDACTTVSNLGSFGVDSFIPIVVPPQASILGLGKINDTPIPQKNTIAVRKIMKMTLAVDHRTINGAYAAEFLDALRYNLEDTQSFNI